MAPFDFNEKFRQRTEKLSLRIIDWYSKLDHSSEEIQIVGKQLIMSVTATAAGFRAACRAKSRSERCQKLSSVVENSDQTLFWLDLFKQLQPREQQNLDPIYKEALEILKVMATHRKNLKIS
jgi:four helix bundle protein